MKQYVVSYEAKNIKTGEAFVRNVPVSSRNEQNARQSIIDSFDTPAMSRKYKFLRIIASKETK